MAAEDVWQLKIPVRLALAQDEISSPGDVKPVYLLASRFAYLPALAQQCLNFFQHVLLNIPGQPVECTPWFEFDGLALHWTQPLGVLHDLLTPQPTQWPSQQQQQQQQKGPGAFSTVAIPWGLTVHYRNQPASLSNSWQNSGTSKEHYFSSLKEAGYCCRGTDGCNAVMRLPGPAQDDLWAAVNRGDGAGVRQHTTTLRLSPTQRQGSSIPTVPVRLYVRQHKSSDGQGLIGVWAQVYSTSRALEVQQPGGSATLLAHLLAEVMPQHFPPLQQASTTAAGGAAVAAGPMAGSSQPSASAGQQQQQGDQHPEQAPKHAAADTGREQDTAGAGDPLGVLTSTRDPAAGQPVSQEQQRSSSSGSSRHPAQEPAQVEAASHAPAAVLGDDSALLPAGWPACCAAYVCGTQPDWCTPVGWLHTNFKAADGFLYVVVHLAT